VKNEGGEEMEDKNRLRYSWNGGKPSWHWSLESLRGVRLAQAAGVKLRLTRVMMLVLMRQVACYVASRLSLSEMNDKVDQAVANY